MKYDEYIRQQHGNPETADGFGATAGMAVFVVHDLSGSNPDESREYIIKDTTLNGRARFDGGWRVQTGQGWAFAHHCYTSRVVAKAWILAEYQKEKDEIDAKIRRLK